MQIQKPQSSQTFGTLVKMDPYTARIISVSKANNKVLRNIRQLEKNGADDILYLSLGRREHFTVKASLYEKKGKDYYVSASQEQPISQMTKNGKNKLVDIKQMYADAKNNLKAVVINKKGFKNFLQYIENKGV